MTDTILGLLRHGQTDWNIDMRLQGITDIALNETGLTQAAEVATQLRSEDWDLLVASPLSRAIDTAKAISSSFGGFQIRIEPLLLERSFGDAEGLTYQEYKIKYAGLKTAPGGETLEELRIRVDLMLEHFSAEYSGKRVLAVTHGALIRKVISVVTDNQLPHEGERFANTSLSSIRHSVDTGWQIQSFEPGVYRR